VPLPDMALEIVLALEEVIECAPVHWTGVIYGGVMDGVDMAAEVLQVPGRWCVACRKAAFARVGGDMRAAMGSVSCE
jgi:hypothetical protein